MIGLLSDGKPQVREEAAGALKALATNPRIAALIEEETARQEKERIPKYVKTLKETEDPVLKEEALKELLRLAAENDANKAQIRELGGMVALLTDARSDGVSAEAARQAISVIGLLPKDLMSRSEFAPYEPTLAADLAADGQRTYIASLPALSEYCSLLQTKIYGVYIAALSINSKMVKSDDFSMIEGAVSAQGVKWTSGLIAKLLEGIPLVGSIAGAALEGAVAKIRRLGTENRIGHFLKYFPTARTALDQIEAVVRQLTLAQEVEIVTQAVVKTPRGMSLLERCRRLKDELIVNDVDTPAKAFAAKHLHEILILLMAETLSEFTFTGICKALNISMPAAALPTAHGATAVPVVVSVMGGGGGGGSAGSGAAAVDVEAVKKEQAQAKAAAEALKQQVSKQAAELAATKQEALKQATELEAAKAAAAEGKAKLEAAAAAMETLTVKYAAEIAETRKRQEEVERRPKETERKLRELKTASSPDKTSSIGKGTMMMVESAVGGPMSETQATFYAAAVAEHGQRLDAMAEIMVTLVTPDKQFEPEFRAHRFSKAAVESWLNDCKEKGLFKIFKERAGEHRSYLGSQIIPFIEDRGLGGSIINISKTLDPDWTASVMHSATAAPAAHSAEMAERSALELG